MANVRNANTIYIDSTGTLTEEKNIKVSHVLFTPNASGDHILLTDGDGGANKFSAKSSTAKTTLQFRMELHPLVFPNGIHVQTLTASATAVLIVNP